MISEKTYSTADLALGSYLKAKNLELIQVDRPQGERKAFFVFRVQGEEDVQDLIRGFYEDAPVGARSYADSMNALKGALYNF